MRRVLPPQRRRRGLVHSVQGTFINPVAAQPEQPNRPVDHRVDVLEGVDQGAEPPFPQSRASGRGNGGKEEGAAILLAGIGLDEKPPIPRGKAALQPGAAQDLADHHAGGGIGIVHPVVGDQEFLQVLRGEPHPQFVAV